DTGKPAAGARVVIIGVQRVRGPAAFGRTDKDGRFRINPCPGKYFTISVYAPPGGAYHDIHLRLPWAKGGAVVFKLKTFALERGVLLHGTIRDGVNGKPVSGATVVFRQFQHNNPNRQNYISMPTTSGKDGTWKLTAPTSRGLLLCTAPGNDFLTSVVGSTDLLEGRPGGDRRFYDCVIALDLKPQKKPKEVPVTLRRGVTLRGKLV